MRFVLLDLMRAVAIIMLVFGHVAWKINLPIRRFFGIEGFYYVTLGGLAVTIFLILSGVVLELNYGSKKPKLGHFMLKRYLKIYPVYYMTVILGIMVIFVRQYYRTGSPVPDEQIMTGTNLIGSLTGMYCFFGQWGGPFVSTGWFIGVIMSLYLIYPVLSKAIRQRPNTTLAALLIISVISRLIMGKYQPLPDRALEWFPLCRIFEFGLGVYLAHSLSPDFWLSFNKAKPLAPTLAFISNISLPLFLVHYPMMFLISHFTRGGMNSLLAVAIYLVACMLISYIIMLIDKLVPRKAILTLLTRKEMASSPVPQTS